MSSVTELSSSKCFGGYQKVLSHERLVYAESQVTYSYSETQLESGPICIWLANQFLLGGALGKNSTNFPVGVGVSLGRTWPNHSPNICVNGSSLTLSLLLFDFGTWEKKALLQFMLISKKRGLYVYVGLNLEWLITSSASYSWHLLLAARPHQHLHILRFIRGSFRKYNKGSTTEHRTCLEVKGYLITPWSGWESPEKDCNHIL